MIDKTLSPNNLGVTLDLIDDYLPSLAYQDLLYQSQGRGKSDEDHSPLRKLSISFLKLIEGAIKLDKIVEKTDSIKNFKIKVGMGNTRTHQEFKDKCNLGSRSKRTFLKKSVEYPKLKHLLQKEI